MGLKFEELRSLDLRRCASAGDIVAAMRHCAFGARMLGEMATTLHQLILDRERPLVIYDGLPDSPLGRLLARFVERGWCRKILRPEQYARRASGKETVLVVGGFSERHADAVYRKPSRALFINQFDLARPGQIRDGYFPDAVFADPRLVLPVIDCALTEWLDGRRWSAGRLLASLGAYGGVASQVARAATALQRMVQDRDCLRFLTVSGAMTVGKMDLVICDMIEHGFIDAITSTGALMAHGLVSSIGLKHYKYDPSYDDTTLARHRLNRVTDTLEPETNLDSVEEVIGKVIEPIDGSRPISPAILNRHIGRYLARRFPRERGILKSAYQHGVPVFVPAFVDSELGNDLYIHNLKRRRRGRKPILIDHEIDSRELIRLVTGAKRFGIFTIGGGVPRNNVQNVAPLIEIINERLGAIYPERRFHYGIRICPDRPHFGHLSGCTYSENESWRKAAPDGVYAEVQADATQVWPFLVKFLMDNTAGSGRTARDGERRKKP
ncbi:MAG TPA: deoxyhypusine synthase family protein [candidate division Zixibacteria bacterium]|nr:deoxyhypusine synthase family protein [candidate division Zixibacteria bacterium]